MTFHRKLVASAALLCCSAVFAGPVLIINGASGTSETGTTTLITNNLKTLHEAAGNTVTIADDIPLDLSLYSQVWDIRFDNSFALTTSQQAEYLSFLQGGGGMFLMGENSSFMARNTSIFDFVSLLGGGSLGPDLIGGCDGTQTVNAPFTGAAPVTSINFNCSGVIASNGTGEWITERESGGGSGVAWGVGSLANATAGALTMVLDVNFMQGVGSEAEQNLTKNLIGYVGDQVDPPSNDVPEPGSFGLAGLALLGLAFSSRARKPRAG